MRIINRSVITASLFLLCFSQFAVADEYHYNNMLIGDRASGMGGAYTAISDDATGLFYNPAAIVYVGDKNFSASVNAYYIQSKQYDNVIGNKPFKRNSSALLANYFGIVKPFGNFKVGFSYAVPDAVSEDQSQSFDNVGNGIQRHTINLSNRDSTYNFGPSIATEIRDDLSVGLTLYAHQRDSQLILNQFQEYSTPTNTDNWMNVYYRLKETGIKPVLGVSWAPIEKLSLGLSLSKTFVLSSETTYQASCWDTTGVVGKECPGSTPGIQRPNIITLDTKKEYPTRIAFGTAYFVDRNLLVSGDLTYHTAVPNKVAVVNVALGTEYYLSKQWAIRGGFYTNVANTPNIVAGVTDIEEQINLYGLSMSLSNFSGSSAVTVGGTVNYGKGKAQLSTDNTQVQNASTLGLLLFLSSSY